MTRVSFFEPSGDLTPELVSSVLGLADARVDAGTINQWTELEKLLAYDWAIRVHLRASDQNVWSRPCPSFVRAAAASSGNDPEVFL